jgi:hypothetical protein
MFTVSRVTATALEQLAQGTGVVTLSLDSQLMSYRRQRGSACCEMQELAAGKFHSSPSAACDPTGTGTSRLIPFLRSRKWQCRLLAHRVDLLRCEGSDAIGAKRTCRERRERVDLTKMTHQRHWLCTAAARAEHSLPCARPSRPTRSGCCDCGRRPRPSSGNRRFAHSGPLCSPSGFDARFEPIIQCCP